MKYFFKGTLFAIILCLIISPVFACSIQQRCLSQDQLKYMAHYTKFIVENETGSKLSGLNVTIRYNPDTEFLKWAEKYGMNVTMDYPSINYGITDNGEVIFITLPVFQYEIVISGAMISPSQVQLFPKDDLYIIYVHDKGTVKMHTPQDWLQVISRLYAGIPYLKDVVRRARAE